MNIINYLNHMKMKLIWLFLLFLIEILESKLVKKRKGFFDNFPFGKSFYIGETYESKNTGAKNLYFDNANVLKNTNELKADEFLNLVSDEKHKIVSNPEDLKVKKIQVKTRPVVVKKPFLKHEYTEVCLRDNNKNRRMLLNFNRGGQGIFGRTKIDVNIMAYDDKTCDDPSGWSEIKEELMNNKIFEAPTKELTLISLFEGVTTLRNNHKYFKMLDDNCQTFSTILANDIAKDGYDNKIPSNPNIFPKNYCPLKENIFDKKDFKKNVNGKEAAKDEIKIK